MDLKTGQPDKMQHHPVSGDSTLTLDFCMATIDEALADKQPEVYNPDQCQVS